MLPSPDILNDYPHGKFVLSNLAAKRAKQLLEGAPPLVHVESHHPLTIALAEIAAGKIKAVLPTGADAIEAGDEVVLVEGGLTTGRGMLLPAIDESEMPLIGTAVIADEEQEIEVDLDDATSLADLVDEDEEVAPVAGDEDTLSLTDIAAQETADEDLSDDEE